MSAAGGRREKAAHYSSSLRETVMSFLYYHIIDQSELKTVFFFRFPTLCTRYSVSYLST